MKVVGEEFKKAGINLSYTSDESRSDLKNICMAHRMTKTFVSLSVDDNFKKYENNKEKYIAELKKFAAKQYKCRPEDVEIGTVKKGSV